MRGKFLDDEDVTLDGWDRGVADGALQPSCTTTIITGIDYFTTQQQQQPGEPVQEKTFIHSHSALPLWLLYKTFNGLHPFQ